MKKIKWFLFPFTVNNHMYCTHTCVKCVCVHAAWVFNDVDAKHEVDVKPVVVNSKQVVDTKPGSVYLHISFHYLWNTHSLL